MTTPTPEPPTQPDRPASTWSWFRFTRNAIIIAALVGFGSWYVVAGVIPNVFPKNFGVVEEGVLYRAGRLTPAATEKVVKKHGIRTIIDFGGFDHHPDAYARAVRTAEALGVRHVTLPLFGDATGDPNRYAEALRILADPTNHPVLTHCAAGSERTGCLVGLYRISTAGYTVDDVIAESQTFRHNPEKNPDLRTVLTERSAEILEAVRTGRAIPYTGPTNDMLEIRGLEPDEIGTPTLPTLPAADSATGTPG